MLKQTAVNRHLHFQVMLKSIKVMISVTQLITNDHLSFTISTGIMKRTLIWDTLMRAMIQKIYVEISD